MEKYNKSQTNIDGVIILLHGLGASADDLAPLVEELNLTRSFKFVFPNAPIRPITINGGYKMQAWYDIKELNLDLASTDIAGIDDSFDQIQSLIEDQIKLGFTPNQIVIAGFSQGGMMSYTILLKSKYKLAGGLILSGYLPNISINIANGMNKNSPILVCHGKFDDVLTYEVGKLAYDMLSKHGYNIQFRDYSTGHNICAEELIDINKFLNSIPLGE